MTIRFTARVAGVAKDRDPECLAVGVAESDDGDGHPGLGRLPMLLDHSRPQPAPDPLAENGRGLSPVRELSRGTAGPTPRRPSPPAPRPRRSPSPSPPAGAPA